MITGVYAYDFALAFLIGVLPTIFLLAFFK